MSHIIFESVKYKNFLASGDKFIEIALNRTSNTLVVGSNGAGKSTMLDAIAFSLFGKAHRNIKKPLLVNSINGKKCEVELEFSIGEIKYKIIRGIKPSRFEIYKNSELLNQSSTTKDYQKILEQNIIKMNYKSFHQVVVLGSSSFIPFMELPAWHRRDVIEDLLDIQVFSKMGIIVKGKVQSNKENFKEVENAITLAKNNVGMKEKHYKEIDNLGDIWLKSKQDEIAIIEKKVALCIGSIDYKDYTDEEAELESQITQIHTNKTDIVSKKNVIEAQLSVHNDKADIFMNNDVCHTCEQNIDEDHKTHQLHNLKSESFVYTLDLNEHTTKINELTSVYKDLSAKYKTLKENKTNNDESIKELNRYKIQHEKLSTDIANLKVNNTDKADQLKSEINQYNDILVRLNVRRSALVEEGLYYQSIAEMLKDTGIKTKVIKQYLPVINTTINKYLSILDFFVQFNLDENFNETMRSRHRDEFVYASFSEGEKARIDLSLIFTWRHIARLRNSSSTNLLILDETFDSSLDVDGLENLMKILDTLPDGTNTFVISHKTDVLESKFRSVIKFDKKKNFSVIV